MKLQNFAIRAISVAMSCLMLVSAMPLQASAAGIAAITELTTNGVNYGEVKVDGRISRDRKVFNVEGENRDWNYFRMAANSTCVIKPSTFGGIMEASLESYVLENGVYVANRRDDWAETQLLANGKSTVGWGTFPYEGEYIEHFPTSERPASFVFGHNSGETPIYGGEYNFTLYPNETLYVLKCRAYDANGNGIVEFSIPYFVEGSLDTPFVPSITAKPNTSVVGVNKSPLIFDSYNINDNNYFKLRDLAYVLSGTEKQFEVSWDGGKNAINLISGKKYTIVGGEMAEGDGTAKAAEKSTDAVYIDGKRVELTAYNINGNNYFKLRDIGKAFNFDVSWDGGSNSISIDTKVGYTED